SLLPDLADISYDVNGQGYTPARIVFLLILTLGTVCSMLFCAIIWARIYRSNRNDLSENLIRRRRIGTTVILVAALFTTANGAWLAHWLGNQAIREQTSTLLSALHLGVGNLDIDQIQQIHGEPEETKGNAFAILRAELIEIRNALPDSRFAYILGMRNDRLVFLTDAEDPNNSETFSPPGEPVKDYPTKWGPELAGQSTFSGPDRDEWGVWFSAVVPIFDENHQVAALLGVDYPAHEWLKPIAARRLAAMGVTLSVALLLIALFAFHLGSIENAVRLESLSDRLSNAMTAAEFDTWEYFPKTLKINIGERISQTLGWGGSRAKPSFRQIWRNIHTADRYQLLNLMRPPENDRHASSEAEVRIRDGNGRWVWFMLRGRMVRSAAEDTLLVGTILNIDENHRSRLEIDKQRRFAQHVMESVPNGLAIVSAEGVLSYANPAFIRLSHGDAASLAGRKLSTLIQGADALPTGSGGAEAVLTCIDGASVSVRAFMAPLTESGQIAGSILAIVDLTSAKEAEQNLLRSRAEASRLALVAKRTDNAVVITDATGRIEWVNEGFTQISGYSKDEALGKTPGSFLQRPGSAGDAQSLMREHIKAGKGFETEILNYSKSGRAYLVHIECQPLVDRDGTLTGFMALERDITRTRRSSNLLEAVASISTTLLSKRIEPSVWWEILRALGTAASVDRCHLFQVHPHGATGSMAASETAVWNLGSSDSENLRMEFQDIPFDQSGFGRWLREMLAGNEICGLVSDFPAEEQVLLNSQNVRSMVVVPIFAADRFWGFMGFDACHEDRVWEDWEISILRSAAANIGLRQVAQNESDALVLARDEAHQAAIAAVKANLAKSTFLATMSHEIRTPLNAVLGMASLLETTSLNPQQQDYAATILNSSNFLLELINDILDYSRIESGKIELDSSPFTLANVCRDAFDVIRPGAMGKEIELICRVAPHLPIKLQGDRARIRQILVNLLSNAVKFTSTGFVSMMVEGRETPEGKWDITFQVRDSGIGIAPEAIGRLFRPFVQEDSSTTRRFGGSGLGLAISKRLAELMDGDITVTSVRGEGSTFLTAIRLSSTLTADVAPQAPLHIATGIHPAILIVDDNPLNLRILEETLASSGLSCHTADHSTQAIALWRQNGAYDLVISDHHMPDMDGVSLTQYLRSLGTGNTRFILLSSETNHTQEIRELFDEVGSKPIWPSIIQGILTRLFPGIIAEPAETHRPARDFEPSILENLRVLVAEDNPNNQKVIRLLLRRLGIEPTIVDNGAQAVEAARANVYDIMLLDIQMPVMDGLEATRGIRALNLTNRPVIVALTANAFQEDRDAASAAGMDSYLSKPITLARLRDCFTSILNPVTQPD
ncbi:MAG: response regulator, partial [Luteolibacter sp.]